MDQLEIQTLGNSLPECFISPYRFSDTVGDDGNDFPTSLSNAAESGIIESIYDDDKSSLLALSKLLQERLSEPLDRSVTSKLLHLSCAFDSAECAAALLAGDVGEVPLVNAVDETGRTALHVAAEYHAARCVELLLRKRARSELRTRDGRGQLALELSLSSARFDKGVVWNPDDYSIEDLVVLIGEKDLTTIRLICEKTKEVAEVACSKAVEGSAAALAALLVVAPDKINDSTLEFRRPDSASKDKCTTVYESVVREALSLGLETTASSPSSSSETTTNDTSSEKRKILLAEIELLQLFDVVSHSPDKKVKSPLIRAVQAADEVVVALLLKASIDIGETDVEGNSAIHYSLKASRASSPQELKILMRLLKHGARVSQRNKLGLTALHMAAGNGHLQGVQILLLADPDGISYKTEMKETPLFFAVKNDHLDCAEFLLRWGANSEVFNIRRQRPIDLAKSQDMRFMLSPTNIALMNRNFPGQPKNVSGLPDDEDYCETLLSQMDDYAAASERGAKCFYSHSAEDRQKVKQGTQQSRRSPFAEMDLKKRIFVGGLPLVLNSASLRKFFEEHFGPVEDAKVLVTQTGSQTQSRGFGFVSFKDEESVSAAIQAHYVFIMDKQVEIKSVIAKWDDCEGKSDQHQPQAHVLSESLDNTFTAFEGQQIPMWLRVFKKWLPGFIKSMTKHRRDGEYALSSLKGDFRAKFGLELDHASLGYPKLSDFMKCFSDLCCTRVLPIGRTPNHMVLRPNPVRSQQLLRRLSTIKSILSGDENHSIDSMLSPGTCENLDPTEKPDPSNEFTILNSTAAMAEPSDAQPMFLQLLEQDPLFHIRPWLQTEYNTTSGYTNDETGSQIELRHQQRHLVLEALARSRENPSLYFLREFDFYSNYNESVREGKCFACNERKLLWANFPCQHLLWCVDCKAQASLAAGSLIHKCVVCDTNVRRIDLLTCNDYRRLVGQYIFNEEFPPFDPNQLRSPSTKKSSPLVGN